MNAIVVFLIVCVGLFYGENNLVESQPISDAHNINFFFEMLNPSFRQHRARLRPFGNQLGTPVINVRGARDLSKLDDKQDVDDVAQCIYSFESLYCSGYNHQMEKVSVECDAKEDFKHTKYAQMSEYSVGDLRVMDMNANDERKIPVVKMYLYPKTSNSSCVNYRTTETNNQVHIFSIHHGQEDKGLNVLDEHCWLRFIKFIVDMKNKKSMLVRRDSNNVQSLAWTRSISTVANLIIL